MVHNVRVLFERLLVFALLIQCLSTVLLEPNTLIVVNSYFITRVFEEDANDFLAPFYIPCFHSIAR